ncbi:hypothetical protein [Kitasatospora sp. DSM 101779]|uniref:hypothetical protein n=1 Tax=Kitasatospora sp. DSM 101779 TaxID=2853165 RepID=UPI0021D8FD3B|nr:hypothetical protein [Kitasatospora sp. DSM 101779]MCU7825344.1 hypothetical protein [Kitasatospora sp. DSM 101779]
MPFLHRAVLIRAAAAALALGAALGVQTSAGQALARRGAEQAARDARACLAAAAALAELGGPAAGPDGRPAAAADTPAGRCGRTDRQTR